MNEHPQPKKLCINIYANEYRELWGYFNESGEPGFPFDDRRLTTQEICWAIEGINSGRA